FFHSIYLRSLLLYNSFISPLYLFFFYYYAHHRDLHSFPTRRSSDLKTWRRDVEHALVQLRKSIIADYIVLGGGNAKKLDELPERSEEHTSELQSRGHLVCRLLLEKKK